AACMVAILWPGSDGRRSRRNPAKRETVRRGGHEGMVQEERSSMNVVIWARVSSREQREGYSIDAQLRATRDKAQKSGWHVVREFAVAETAKRGAERVAFNEMFQWVRTNAKREKIQAILSHKLDRVCRNMRDAVRLQELEDSCGVQLCFVENQFGPGAA